MKEVKAYVRAEVASRVAEVLTGEPGLHFSVLEAKGISPGLPRESYEFSVALAEPFEPMVKFEIVCRDESAERLATLIREAAYTGRQGDGMIFIAAVEEAIRIGSGARGPSSLPE
jgi:nitrogen regulatory protein PII